MRISCNYQPSTCELNEEWLVANGFRFCDGDQFQKHYVPPNVGEKYYFRYRLSVSPYNKVRMTDVGLELQRVEHLNYIYDLLNRSLPDK